jgi:hypothetical protein
MLRPVDLTPGTVLADGRTVTGAGPTIDDRLGARFLVSFDDGSREAWRQADAARFATVEVAG